MNKKAFTLMEMMVAMILFLVVITGIWQVYSGARKNAKEVLENHGINEEMDRTLIKIIDDIREANAIDPDFPPIYEASDILNLKTEDEKNQLKFIKVKYDFSKDPSDLDEGEKNYTSNLIRYYVEKENNNENSKWLLNREMVPLDEKQEPVESQASVYNLLSGIDQCIFYRVKDPEASRTGNIYIKLKMGRLDNGKYSNESIISVKERGAIPES